MNSSLQLFKPFSQIVLLVKHSKKLMSQENYLQIWSVIISNMYVHASKNTEFLGVYITHILYNTIIHLHDIHEWISGRTSGIVTCMEHKMNLDHSRLISAFSYWIHIFVIVILQQDHCFGRTILCSLKCTCTWSICFAIVSVSCASSFCMK